MSALYPLLKLLHIVSATILFGTGLGTAFQMWSVQKSGNVRAIATVARQVVWADILFTTPAVVVQPLSGFALIWLTGIDPLSPWLLAAYALYVLTGLCWLPVVFIQLRLRDLAAEAAESGAPLPQRYNRLWRLWFALGWPAFSAVLAIFWLMVAKPDLW
jgi:uncharacterized membrane protein